MGSSTYKVEMQLIEKKKVEPKLRDSSEYIFINDELTTKKMEITSKKKPAS